MAPLGYINVQRNGIRRIEPDPCLAPLVTQLFEWYSTGKHSLKFLACKAYEEGLAYRKSGSRIGKSTLHHILTSPIHYGDFRWGGRWFRGSHQPLVSKELWDKVHDVLNGNASCKARPSKHQWAFQGMVSCGHCGCTLTAETKKSRYVYYHCTGQRGKCPEKYVREEDPAAQFGVALKSIKLQGDVLSWIVSALKASHTDQKRYRDSAISSLQQQHRKLQNRLDQMYEDKLDGIISQEFFDRKSADWRNEMTQIMRSIENHQKASESCMEEGIRILELADRAWRLYEKQEMAEKAEIAGLRILELHVGERKTHPKLPKTL